MYWNNSMMMSGSKKEPPTFVATGTAVTSSGSQSVDLPTGYAENDILLLVLVCRGGSVTGPGGSWTELTSSPQSTGPSGGAVQLSAWWKRSAASESAPSVTGSNHTAAQMLAFRGCPVSGSPIDTTTGDTGSSSTSITIPSVTTTSANCLIVDICGHNIDSSSAQVSSFTNANLTSLTERTDICNSVNSGGGFAVATGIKVSAGSTGTTTATQGSATDQARIKLALKPK